MTGPKPMQPPLDAERIAALLDGKLPAPERDAVLRTLAESPDDYDDALEASLILADIENGDTGAPDLRVSATGRRPNVQRWLLAASIAAIGIVGVLSQREGRDSLLRFAEHLPAGVIYTTSLDREPWTALRGEVDAVSDVGRAVRIGARLTDLTLALRSGHSEAAMIAMDLARLLETRQGGQPIAEMVRSAAANPSRGQWIAIGATLNASVDADMIALGAWVQAARTALDAGEANAIDRSAGTAVIDDALPAMRERPAVAQVARDVRALLVSAAPAASLQPALTRLLTEAAR